jgi:hypothetical protein
VARDDASAAQEPRQRAHPHHGARPRRLISPPTDADAGQDVVEVAAGKRTRGAKSDRIDAILAARTEAPMFCQVVIMGYSARVHCGLVGAIDEFPFSRLSPARTSATR